MPPPSGPSSGHDPGPYWEPLHTLICDPNIRIVKKSNIEDVNEYWTNIPNYDWKNTDQSRWVEFGETINQSEQVEIMEGLDMEGKLPKLYIHCPRVWSSIDNEIKTLPRKTFKKRIKSGCLLSYT